MSIAIEIDEAQANRIKQALGEREFWAAVGRGMSRGARRVWQDLPPYPSPPTGSTYRRTGELGRRFTVGEVQVSANSVTVAIGNNTRYAGFVVGPDMGNPHQAWMHKGRWWQLDKEMEKDVRKVTEPVEDELSRLVD